MRHSKTHKTFNSLIKITKDPTSVVDISISDFKELS